MAVYCDIMIIKVICQALKRIRNIGGGHGREALVCALAYLGLHFCSGCVFVQSSPYPPPVYMAAVQEGVQGDHLRAGIWAALLFGLALAGLAAYGWRRLGYYSRPGVELDREDMALLRTAREALVLFNRKKRGFGLKQSNGTRKRL